jgi:hypothetical protein
MITFPHCQLWDPAWDMQLVSVAGEARVSRFTDDRRVALYWRSALDEMFAVAICDSYTEATNAAQAWVEEAVAPGSRAAARVLHLSEA